MDMYFVIHNSGGDTSVKMLTKEQLLEEIQDEDYRPEFLTEADLKKERDPNC